MAADKVFDPERFFAGETFSSGQIDALGSSPQSFTARFIGRASSGVLVLEERFSFATGERLQLWELRRMPDGSYAGTVQTETGDGTLREPRPVRGELTGSGAVLRYVGYAPGQGATLFRFRHSMTAQPDATVANRVTVSKLGLPVATARVTFAKSREQLLPR